MDTIQCKYTFLLLNEHDHRRKKCLRWLTLLFLFMTSCTLAESKFIMLQISTTEATNSSFSIHFSPVRPAYHSFYAFKLKYDELLILLAIQII